MLTAGWNAHKLNAPGKFLISAPEHDIPRRARAYLVTDDATGAHQSRSGRHTELQKGTLGGSNRLLSSRDVAAILAVPERTVRDKWKEWGLPAYRIGKHLRWKERDVYAWIERQSA
jgi:excisionase family DNA binding protein